MEELPEGAPEEARTQEGRRGRSRGSGLVGSTQRDRVHRGWKERYGGRREEQRWRRGLVGLQSKVRTGLGIPTEEGK